MVIFRVFFLKTSTGIPVSYIWVSHPGSEYHTLHTISTFVDETLIQLSPRQRRKIPLFFLIKKLVFQCFSTLKPNFHAPLI